MLSFKIKIHSLLLALVTVLLIITVIVVREMELFNIPLLFAFAILFEILLLILFVYELIMVLAHPLKILGSVLLSGFKGMFQNPYLDSLKERYPLIRQFFLKEQAAAKVLILGFFISFLFFLFFLNIGSFIFSGNSSVVVDERILSLIPDIRTPLQTEFFSFVTFLMNWQSIIFISIFIVIYLFYKKQRLTAILFAALMSLAGFSSFVLKYIFGRIRPDDNLALISESYLSFPSQHALFSTLIFGLLIYFSTRSSRHPLLKFFIFIFGLLVVSLISLSRVYMGVHYPTDLLGGIMLGFSFLTLFVALVEVNRKYAFFEELSSGFFKDVKGKHLKGLMAAPILLALFSLSFHSYFIYPQPIKAPYAAEIIPTLNSDVINQLNRYTESINGRPIEPISFIFVATQDKLEATFQEKGWFKADPATVSNGLKALSAAFKNEAYNNGTVTPAYFDSKPQTLTFQISDKLDSFRERHHIRLWETEYDLKDGRSVWVGTASFDVGLKFNKALILTHKIDPNIDAERAYILESLALKNFKYIQMVKPQQGINAFGDEFFTDGKAVLIEF